MSRSYKKVPRCGDAKSKSEKRRANRKLRREKLTHNLKFGIYKKHHNSWNICDFEEVGTSFEQYWLSVVRHWLRFDYRSKPYPNREAVYKEWYLTYKRK